MVVQGVSGHDALADCGTGSHEGGDGIEGAREHAEAERLCRGEDVECVKRTEGVEGLEAGEEETTDGTGRLVFRHSGALAFFSVLYHGKVFVCRNSAKVGAWMGLIPSPTTKDVYRLSE